MGDPEVHNKYFFGRHITLLINIYQIYYDDEGRVIGIFNNTLNLITKYMQRVTEVHNIPEGDYYARFKTGKAFCPGQMIYLSIRKASGAIRNTRKLADSVCLVSYSALAYVTNVE